MESLLEETTLRAEGIGRGASGASEAVSGTGAGADAGSDAGFVGASGPPPPPPAVTSGSGCGAALARHIVRDANSNSIAPSAPAPPGAPPRRRFLRILELS